MNKIITLKQLDKIERSRGKLVLVGGCFDIFHIGHLRFLEEAKKTGDLLLVALEPDKTVKKLKGKTRPIHNQTERSQILAELFTVDYVLLLESLNTDAQYFSLVKKIKPDIIAVTENDPILEKKKKQAEEVGGKIIIIPKLITPSTTQLTKLLEID